MSVEFTLDEKIALFDKIQERYFNKKFGMLTKSDIETLLFSEYIEHYINSGLPFDDYTLSKELGITQTRIRSLKERKELVFPHENFRWETAFAQAVVTAKYDEHDHYVKMIIQDINVMNEVRHYIETKGWYDECSLNRKLLRIPLDCFVEICSFETNFENAFTDEAKKNIGEIAKKESVAIDFLKDFSKQGLQAFLMSASKELILTILPLLPFGGTAKVAFELLGKVIGGK